ncbi:MAG TPA: Rid family detoxifying hydrolase [Candidatus Saccharimonadales bacterium]|nr:Rid family detoxifying hydrolase [Candidatus Saccharimonadales bacterium]
MLNLEPVQTDAAPAAIGPYSQGMAVNTAPHGITRIVATAGQLGMDPATGELVGPGVAAQTERALRNLAAILAAQDLSLAHVVKTTVFLADMGEFTAMNEVYARFFPERPPARSTVAVLGLPKGARVEIEAWAAR